MRLNSRRIRHLLFPIVIVLVALLSGCQPPISGLPQATQTAVPPSPLPTSILPTATRTSAAPTPTDVGLMLSFPNDVNPLTGEQVADPSLLDRRPLAIKISNSPMQLMRPQSGIAAADLVFEHYAEGGVTRLTAVYLGHDALLIGPVRSGRMIDLEIPVMYQAMFVCSGYSSGLKGLVRTSDLYAQNRIISQDFGAGEPPFQRLERGPDVPYEHTLYTSTSALWAEAATRGLNQRQELTGMAFTTILPPGGIPVTTLQIQYSASEAHVEWRHDAASGRWRRWQGGNVFTDTLDGQQVSAANVVLVYANHVQTDIPEDTLGNVSIQIQVWGTGPAKIYRDGQQIDGFWIRQHPGDMLAFTDAAGNRLSFRTGNTWFEVVTLDAATYVTGKTVIVTPQ